MAISRRRTARKGNARRRKGMVLVWCALTMTALLGFLGLVIDGHEVLVGDDDTSDPMRWGCYPMVPWAGRVAYGRFEDCGDVRVRLLRLLHDVARVHGLALLVDADRATDHDIPHRFVFDALRAVL